MCDDDVVSAANPGKNAKYKMATASHLEKLVAFEHPIAAGGIRAEVQAVGSKMLHGQLGVASSRLDNMFIRIIIISLLLVSTMRSCGRLTADGCACQHACQIRGHQEQQPAACIYLPTVSCSSYCQPCSPQGRMIG